MNGSGSAIGRVLVFVSTASAALLATPLAMAQGSDSVTAEALFQEGRELQRQGKLGQACPKLAESYRLDPATGTLMALAKCHEDEGKLASAWAEYTDAASRAKTEGREDREQACRQAATALRPRLSSLRVEVPDSVATLSSFELKRNGIVLGRAAWNAAIPIDGGRYEIEATAAGKRPFRATVDVKPELDQASVKVPTLDDAGGAGAAAPPPLVASQNPGSPSPATPVDEPSKPLGTVQWVGIGTAAVGVVGWGVGGYFLATALGEKADTKDACEGNVCDSPAFEKRQDMVTHGNMATVFAVGGTVLVGVGATLFLVGGPSDEPRSSRVGVSVTARPGGAALEVGGAF